MKYFAGLLSEKLVLVAPLAGAWIEIIGASTTAVIKLSHPSRVRGLKFSRSPSYMKSAIVAPLAGAWIEMDHRCRGARVRLVAPLAGAWIEIVVCAKR